MEANKLSLDEYLAMHGCAFPVSDYMLDKLRLPHGLTHRQSKKLEKDAQEAADAYHEKRTKHIQAYNALVESGRINPKTRIEELISKAHGHSDNDSVQAARKALEKRGIDWRDCHA